MASLSVAWDGIDDVREQADRVVAVPTSVLLLGKNGTGKEVVARYIHQRSIARHGAFIGVNVAALSGDLLESELFGHVRGAFTGAVADRKGRFTLADKGTIFLDEIADLEPRLQPKILRVLQERCFEPVGSADTKNVDVRVIAASNKDLRQAIAAGTFREDLYYRLAVNEIHIRPLQERGAAAIGRLARVLLRDICAGFGRPAPTVTDDALNLLAEYPWPGNVRQLRNEIERAWVRAGCPGSGNELTIDDFHVSDARSPQRPEQSEPDLGLIGTSIGNFAFRSGRFKAAVLALAASLIEKAGVEGTPAPVLKNVVKMSVDRDALLFDELVYGVAVFITWDLGRIQEPVTTAQLKQRYSSTFAKSGSQIGPIYAKIRELLVDRTDQPVNDETT